MRVWVWVAAILSLAGLMRADVVTTTSGRQIECVVLGEDSEGYTLKMAYGTMLMPRSMVTRVEHVGTPAATPATQSSAAVAPKAPIVTERLASWSDVVTTVIARPWAKGLRQIPATVVTSGTLANVPYLSFRCGPNEAFELNIYGDPDHPAGLEMGVYGDYATDEAKERCLDIIASVMGNQADVATLWRLNRNKDLVKRLGISLEITPPTAEDAMGGWWASVYLDDAIGKARASAEELKRITEERLAATAMAREKEVAERQRIAVATLADDHSSSSAPGSTWTASDFRYARPTTVPSSHTSSNILSRTSAGGGSVYVRGYYRKDGVYVRAHTRASRRR